MAQLEAEDAERNAILVRLAQSRAELRRCSSRPPMRSPDPTASLRVRTCFHAAVPCARCSAGKG